MMPSIKLILPSNGSFMSSGILTQCRRVNNFRRYLQDQAMQNIEGTTMFRNACNCLGPETSTQHVGSWIGRRGAKRTKCLNLCDLFGLGPCYEMGV